MYEIKYREENELIYSGIDWLGSIPLSWTIQPLKYISKYNKGRNPKQIVSEAEGELPYVTASYLRKGETDGYIKDAKSLVSVEEGDLLLLWDGANAGEFFCGKKGVLGSTFAKLILIQEMNFNFFSYYLRSTESYLKYETNGMGVPHIDSSILKNIIITSPLDFEQQKIANFLDIKTAQFDSIILKKEQLIEKFEEAKKSLISEVVTGKVKIVDGELVERDTSEMKDSGVEWLGMVPKDWSIKCIKYISKCYPSNVDKKTKDGEKLVALCNYTDVYYNDYINNDLEFKIASATKAQVMKFKLETGDIILTKDYESPDDIGIASFVDESIDNLVCGYHLTLIRVKQDTNPLYVYHQLSSTGVKNYFGTVANGVTRYGIGSSGFLNLKIVLPTIGEQEGISIFIRSELEANTRMIENIRKQIMLLKQAKQSLISEAVTGKIDLRDWEIIEEGEPK